MNNTLKFSKIVTRALQLFGLLATGYIIFNNSMNFSDKAWAVLLVFIIEFFLVVAIGSIDGYKSEGKIDLDVCIDYTEAEWKKEKEIFDYLICAILVALIIVTFVDGGEMFAMLMEKHSGLLGALFAAGLFAVLCNKIVSMIKQK